MHWINPFSRLPKPETRAAAPLLAWAGLPGPVWTPRDYAALAREGYARNAIVYRCVRMVAEAAASLPLIASAPNHPLASLLALANPDQTGIELLEAFYGHLQVSGNAYLEVVSLHGEPRELYALRPDRVRVLPGPQGWPMGWEHTVDGHTTAMLRDAATGQSPILHLKLFSPIDDHYGLSPLEAAACAIDIHNAGGAWNKALIDNAARPSGALVYRGREGAERLSDDQFARLKADLAATYAGPGNAGRPMLLEGGLEWMPMSLSPAEMDFIGARNAAAREIALAFGVPPMLLGIPGDNTYANYREANLAFWRQTVLPLVSKTAAALTEWLGARWREPVTLRPDLDACPALTPERDALWARLQTATFLSDDEKRAILGMPARSAHPVPQ